MATHVTARRSKSRFGALCEQARIARNVTQEVVAHAAGYTGSYYARMVAGTVVPSMDIFLRTCVTLQLDLTWAIHALAKDMEYDGLIVKPEAPKLEAPKPTHQVYLSPEQVKARSGQLFRGRKIKVK